MTKLDTLQTSVELSELSEIHPFPLIKCDERGDVVYVNTAYRELLTSCRVPTEEHARLLPERYKSILRRARQDKKTHEMKRQREGRFLRFIFRASSDNKHVFVCIIDMTAEEEAKAQLLQSEKMASLGLLIAGLAHEINTPLGAIHSNNDVISRSVDKMLKLCDSGLPAMTAQTKQQVHKVLSALQEVCRNNSMATDRLIGIVGSLKNFARVDEAERKKVDIHEGLNSTLTLVQHQFKNRVRVVKEYGNIPMVECFPNRLNQVFMNMLVNAGQAIADRGTVTIRTWREADSVRISITDTGAGIPPENLPRIFDPGFTTKGVGVGTGLGLSICYKIVQEHQGSIDVRSDSDGTTFTITLPLKAPNEVVHVC